MNTFNHRKNIGKKSPLQNKAQVSLFAVLGIILFIVLILGFFAYNNIKSKAEAEAKKISGLGQQADEIQKFANDCIRKAVFEGLKKLGETGGYFNAPNLISFRGKSYWHIDQVNIQPFLNQTQERLIEYINAYVPACVDEKTIAGLGFNVEKGQPSTFIEFGSADVTIKTVYPIKLSKGQFTKEFSSFFNTFGIRYRAVFEAASQVNEKTFDADFDAREPLKGMDYLKTLDFDIAYKTPETDVMEFTITDKKSVTPENQNYAFSFTAKLGKSDLKKLTQLQDRSATNPSFLPYTIYSVDRKAQLDISLGTTISLNGQDVKSISVQQDYPSNVVTKNVPVEKENKEIKRREDLNYALDNPVYSFNPDGMLFNKLQTLSLYYDDANGKDSKGVGILKGKNGFWVPIPSFEDRTNKKVFADILGFTDFTAVFCASQGLRKTIARQVFEPNAGCYFNLILTIVMLAATAYMLGPGGAFSAIQQVGTLTSQAFSLSGAIEFVAGTIGVSATTLGVLLGGSILSLGLGVAGSISEVYYDSSPENCQTFIPTCTWQVGVGTFEQDGEGRCFPSSGTYQAGIPVTLCAQVEKCNFIEKFTCQECSVECTAQFY